MAARPCRNSERLRQRLSVVYASATRAGSRVFHASSARRAFSAAVSAVKGGSGGFMGHTPTVWRGCRTLSQVLRDSEARTETGRSGLYQTYDLFGREALDLGRFEPQLCQNDRAVLADARRRSSNFGRGAIEARRRFGLSDKADVRVVELGDQ